MANGKAELALEQLRELASSGVVDHGIGLFRCCPECKALRHEGGRISHPTTCNLGNAIAEAERLDPSHGWVPVSERLPPQGYAVLVFVPTYYRGKGGIEVALRLGADAGHWYKTNAWCLEGYVTHWRELPPMPEVKP